MKRILEPELMDDEVQVKAYAEADFDEPHGNFIRLFGEAFGGREIDGHVLDLGCGPGDITFRFARTFDQCSVHAVDGSSSMLEYARQRLERNPTLKERIRFIEGLLPDAQLPRGRYDYLITNSLLHHLPDPDVLWRLITAYAGPGSGVFVMDLLRPQDTRTAKQMVNVYAANEPEVLRRDFYNSLLAAFTLDEISTQLKKHRLDHLSLTQVSDRHFIVSGIVH